MLNLKVPLGARQDIFHHFLMGLTLPTSSRVKDPCDIQGVPKKDFQNGSGATVHPLNQ